MDPVDDGGHACVERLAVRRHIGICLNRRTDVLHSRHHVRAVAREELVAQARPSVPIPLKLIDFTSGNPAEHARVDVPALGSIRRVHIARDVQVVVVGADLIKRDEAAEAFDALTLTHDVGDSLDVTCAQFVVLADLLKALGGVHDQHIGLFALLAQHHDDCGDTGSEEDVGRQADDGLDMAVLQQVAPDLALLATAE
ncbi:Uncharacterised protein [Chlamydia trachomatis]|nr:Uncharacterised protein [Chlamydia trachomatis]